MKIFKKIILFLAIIISVLWIEAVYADMSGPELRQFEVVVTSPDGIDYYDYKESVSGHLNKDDIVVVMYEYNGKYEIGEREKNQYGGHNTLGHINSLNGFSIVEEEVDPTKLSDDNTITKYDTPQKAMVYVEEGVDVYSGPSTVYKKVGHIKKDTKLTYKYAVATYGNVTHIYVSNEGVKGWVEILNGKVLIQNGTQYVFKNDIDTECETIPKNSVTTPIYKTDSWSHDTLFEYNNCSTLIDTFRDDQIINIYPNNYVTTKEITIYKEADPSSELLTTIPAGTEVSVLAGGDIMSGTENTRYIKYNDVIGWSLDDDSAFNWNDSNSEEKEKEKIEDTIKLEDIEIPEKKSNIEEPAGSVEMPRSNFSLFVFIVICALGVSILVATAIVIIVLVNKSKKNKVAPETKVEK